MLAAQQDLLCQCICQPSLQATQFSCAVALSVKAVKGLVVLPSSHIDSSASFLIPLLCARQLNSASTDSSEWVSKYQKAEEGRSVAVADKERTERDLKAQLSHAEQGLAQAQTQMSQAEQQASGAQAALTREKQRFEQKLQEARVQQAQAAPQAAASATPGEHASAVCQADACAQLILPVAAEQTQRALRFSAASVGEHQRASSCSAVRSQLLM